MYATIKKIGLTFVFLNLFLFQSLMADMIFYYSAAILPATISSQQKPIEAVAVYDQIEKDEIEPVTVDVLANDTIAEGEVGTVLLENYNNGQVEWVTQVDRDEGNWVVVDGNVTFTPNASFGGGNAYINYQLTDERGETSQTGFNIIYPLYVQANHDYTLATAVEAVTVDVLDNDNIGEGVIPSVLLENYTDEGQVEYVTQVDQYEGTWIVVDGNVTFTPNENFNYPYAHIEYQLLDEEGHTSKTGVTIEYPIELYAAQDHVQAPVIETVTVDVLANDINSSAVTVMLETYGDNGVEYVTTVETSDGNWYVEANQSVTFTPNASFGGGYVDMWYQITDQEGRTSSTWIHIEYPLYFYAESDQVQTDTIETVIVDVLVNDTITAAGISTLLLESYNNGQIEYITEVTGYGGTWIVDGDTIQFIPDASFGGGSVGIQYQITDEEGHVSTTWITIEFPLYVQANHDYTLATAVEAVTMDVLANDIIGEGVTPSVLLQNYTNDGQVEYLTQVDQYEGTWIVVDGNVTFTPNENFNDRYAHIEYRLLDEEGHISQSGITIEYPVVIYAEQDYVHSDTIEAVTVDVLANDTNISAVTVLFEVYGQNGTEYVSSVEAFDGNWSIGADQDVIFTPNANFGGGHVWIVYQITDQEGRTSTAWISIEYPIFVYAQWDQVQTDTIEPVTIDVLANDTNSSAVTIELVNHNYDTGNDEIGTTITTYQGVWSVNGVEVNFEPDADFGGGYVRIEYQITDQEGRMSRTSIEIIYPIGPSPVCAVTQLTTVEDVYDSLTENLSFEDDNGRREFEAELDMDSYSIDPELYGSSTAVTGLNPMYMVWYDEESRTTSSGDTFIQVEMGSVEIILNNDGNWSYYDQGSGNDRDYKYINEEGESGTYVVEDDESNTLSISGEGAVFSFKRVREISRSEINNILENAGIYVTLESADTAQLQLSKELQSYYDWWGSADGNDYDSLNSFVAANEYNSSETQFNNNGVLRHRETWQKVIIFAEGAAGQSSGTLIEIDRDSNAILVENAGEWRIENITDDDGNTYDIIIAETTLCGYDNHIFRLDGSTIIQGQREEAGVIRAELSFSSSLKDKLTAYFIDEAPLDIDPDNPTSPEITEEMIVDKVFYTVEDHENNEKLFKKITVDSSNYLITKREIYVLEDGTIVSDQTETNSYELDNGRIRLNGDGDVKIGLNSEPGDGDWDVTIYTWDWMGEEIWLLDEPVDFPQDS